MSRRVLIVEDDRGMCEMLQARLTHRGFDVVYRLSAEDALDLLQTAEFDVVVTDMNLQGMSGIALCQQAGANRPDLPVVVITAFGNMDTAVAAIRAGAYDFITKPFDIEVLAITLERSVQHRALREQVKRLQQAVSQSQRVDDILGASPPMKRVFDLIERVSDSEASVLLTGETGTGKEMVAKALHRRSRRSHGPWVAINCAALPEPLLETELFGHARGAFTDARSEHVGLFVRASGGTLFLDEIADMSLSIQAKLLRVLEERKLRPVGSAHEQPFDVRLITATNRDLESAVEERNFREDLYFRINVISLDLPPLRSRGSDVLLLAQHFVRSFAAEADKNVTGVSSPVAERFLAYTWPGNVRELRNCIERAIALTRHQALLLEDLPERIRDHKSSHMLLTSDDPSELVPMEEIERRYILRVLEASGGNKTLAAQTLGFDRKTLYRKLERYEARAEQVEWQPRKPDVRADEPSSRPIRPDN